MGYTMCYKKCTAIYTIRCAAYTEVCCKSKPGLNSVALNSMARSDVDRKKPNLVENPPGGLGNQEPVYVV